MTLTGTSLEMVVPLPSCPKSFVPQHWMAPVASSAHAACRPALMWVALVIPLTATGVALQAPPQSGPAVVPSPSSPSVLSPQHSTSPPASSAQTPPPPALIWVALVIPLAAIGVARQPPPQSGPPMAPFPNSPKVLRPQHSTPPPASNAHVSPPPLLMAVASVTPVGPVVPVGPLLPPPDPLPPGL